MVLNAVSRVPAWLLLAMSCLISVLLFGAPGSSDVRAYWLPWMEKLGNSGLIAGYTLAESDYPPLSFVVLYLAQTFGHSMGWDNFVALKVAIIIFQLISTVMLFTMSGSVFLAAAFNASVILSGVGSGYIDLFFAPPLIGAFWALRGNRPILAVFLFVIACLTKRQPLLIAPFLVIYVLKVNSLQPSAVLALLHTRLSAQLIGLCIAAAFLLFIVFGFEPIKALKRATASSVFVSGNALNLGWIEQFVYRYFIEGSTKLSDVVTFIKDPNPWIFRMHKAMFYLANAVLLLWFVQNKKSIEALLLFSITGYLSYVTLAPGVHENHAFVLLILGSLLAVMAPSQPNNHIAVLMAAMANINLFLFSGFNGKLDQTRVVGVDLTVPMAGLFVLVWIIFMILAAKRFNVMSSETLCRGASESPRGPLSGLSHKEFSGPATPSEARVSATVVDRQSR